MITAPALDWILSSGNIVTFVFLLVLVFGFIFLIIKGD